MQHIINKKTYKKYCREFIKMWNWMSEHPNKYKGDYISIRGHTGIVSNCYACGLAQSIEILLNIEDIKICEFCPLQQKNDNCYCTKSYTDWHREFYHPDSIESKHLQQLSYYAKRVSNEPWYEYEEYCKLIEQKCKK